MKLIIINIADSIIRKMRKIWNNTLILVAVIGTLLLVFTHFVGKIKGLLLFGHIISIVSLSGVAFFSWMLIISNKGRNTSTLLVLIGSIGLLLGFLVQLMDKSVYDKPAVIHMGVMLLCTGIISLYNRYYYGNNIRR